MLPREYVSLSTPPSQKTIGLNGPVNDASSEPSDDTFQMFEKLKEDRASLLIGPAPLDAQTVPVLDTRWLINYRPLVVLHYSTHHPTD